VHGIIDSASASSTPYGIKLTSLELVECVPLIQTETVTSNNDIKWAKDSAKAACWGFVAIGAASTLGLAPIAVTVLGHLAAQQAYRQYSRN